MDNPLDYGKAMGICIGDIGFFIALDICSDVLENHPYKKEVMALLYQELIIVGLAQMDDVTFASTPNMPPTEQILRMYLYKTAHYTFSLPLSLGAILTGKSQEIVKDMEKLGENMGLLFQIRDDEIGVFFDTKKIGKPIGSDLRENKKTLIRALLEHKATPKEKKILENFHKKEITDKDIEIYQDLLFKYNIQAEITKLCRKYVDTSEKLINTLNIPSENKNLLYELISYVSTRTS
jgi:geranylgeranyl diphosphate synthase type I